MNALKRLAALALCVPAVSGCATSVRSVSELADDDRLRQETGATHSMTLSAFPMRDPNAGRDIALREAQKTCGAGSTISANDLSLRLTNALYDFRGYLFECPEPGEVTP